MASHLLLTAIGGYNSSFSAMTNEVWVCTIRLALETSTIGAVGDLSDWQPARAERTDIQTTYAVHTNFDVSSGPEVFRPDDFLANEAKTAWEGLMANGPISNGVELHALKLSACSDPLGKVMDLSDLPGTKAVAELAYIDGSQPSGAGGSIGSPDVSCAYSWRTARADGHGRGRMYPPGLPDSAIASTGAEAGTVTASKRASFLTAGVAFINALKGTSGGWGYDPCVIGRPYTNYSLIRAVWVGKNPDTQRRRTNRVTEEYSIASV